MRWQWNHRSGACRISLPGLQEGLQTNEPNHQEHKNVSFPLKRDVLGTNGKPVLDIFILSSFKQTSPSTNIGSCAQRVDICEQKQPISGAPGLRMWVTRLLIHSLTLWYHSAFLLCIVLTSISSTQESIAGCLCIKTCSDSWWGCKPGCDTACCVYSLFGSNPTMQQEQKIKMDPADNHGNGSPQQYRPLLLYGCFMAPMRDTGTQFLDRVFLCNRSKRTTSGDGKEPTLVCQTLQVL